MTFRLVVSIVVTGSLYFLSPCLGQVTIMTPAVSPAAITTGIPTAVTVSALITTAHASIVANGVNLLQVDQNGGNARVLGTLNDNGANGDVIAGDGVFGGRVTLNQANVGLIYLQISVALQGALRRTLSPIGTLLVTPPGVPNTPHPPNTLTTTDLRTGSTVICDELLVGFQADATQADIDSAAQSVGGVLAGMIAQFSIYQITIPSCDAGSLYAAQTALQNNSLVSFVDLNGVGTTTQITSNANDPYFVQGNQWGLAAVGAPPAWGAAQAAAAAQGRTLATGATIAIIDTGINAAHEDLSGQVIAGVNWCPSIDANQRCTPFNTVTNDDIGHGTMAAGIAAAITNNGLGVASTAYRARIIPEKVNVPGTHIPIDTAATLAIADAVLKGARVINISLAFPMASHAMNLAILDAIAKGVVVVAGAGNSGNSNFLFPAAYSIAGSLIAVGASDQNGQRSTWPLCTDPASNYGPWVTLYAPGSNILGLRYDQTTGPGAYGYYGDVFCSGNGTSFAAPFVAGAVSLMLAVNPALTPAEVKQYLTISATRTGNTDPLGNPVNVLNEFGAVELAAGTQYSFAGHLTQFHSYWCGCGMNGMNITAYGASGNGDVVIPGKGTYYVWFDGLPDFNHGQNPTLPLSLENILLHDGTWVATGATMDSLEVINSNIFKFSYSGDLTGIALQFNNVYGGIVYWNTKPPY